MDAISELEQGASTALITIREWKNSLVPINRIPSDVLSLIPTYLPSQKDRFYATFVCRHWRGTFLQYGALWSEIYPPKGEVYVETLLGRAKESTLDVIVDRDIPNIDTMITLLSPYARQIKYLELAHHLWMEIATFSEISAELPLLRTLKITSTEEYTPYSNPWGFMPERVDPPSSPSFGSAINLERFIFNSGRIQFLTFFFFPRLTTFELVTTSRPVSSASDLFDFLKASPTLRNIKMKTNGYLELEGIPQETIVTLPNVETFSMHIGDGCNVYEIATRISCPFSRKTSLTYDIGYYDVFPGMGIFPTPYSSSAIVHQYSRSPVDEITLSVGPALDLEVGDSIGGYFLSLQFSDASVIRLGSHITSPDSSQTPFDEIVRGVFSQVARTIEAHPLLSHAKRLHIGHKTALSNVDHPERVGSNIGRIFDSMGPLDELTIDGCNLDVFGGWYYEEQPVVFPLIRELIIHHPTMEVDGGKCMEAILGLAESQHAKGLAFERLTLRGIVVPAAMAEKLRQWVDVVDCSNE